MFAEVLSALKTALPWTLAVLALYRLGEWWAEESGESPFLLPLTPLVLYLLTR